MLQFVANLETATFVNWLVKGDEGHFVALLQFFGGRRQFPAIYNWIDGCIWEER